jgi:hypothetical protein
VVSHGGESATTAADHAAVLATLLEPIDGLRQPHPARVLPDGRLVVLVGGVPHRHVLGAGPDGAHRGRDRRRHGTARPGAPARTRAPPR